jgi:hypothetical protein
MPNSCKNFIYVKYATPYAIMLYHDDVAESSNKLSQILQ